MTIIDDAGPGFSPWPAEPPRDKDERIQELLEANNGLVEENRRLRAKLEMVERCANEEIASLAHEIGRLNVDVALTRQGFGHLARFVPTHIHVKTGGLYRVIAEGAMEQDWPDSPVVVYVNGEGQVFVRPEAEFIDGRFRAV